MSIWPQLRHQHSAISKVLSDLETVLAQGRVFRPRQDQLFVLLCGGNAVGQGKPSARRNAVLEFARKNLPETKLILAEDAFDVLTKEKDPDNLLKIEHTLSDFSDVVLIILESNSAFCELGAFAMLEALRKKIVVINDKHHEKSPSFINLGPLAAIQELSGSKKILKYKMASDATLNKIDSIGEVYGDLYNLLDHRPESKRVRLSKKQVTPATITKDSLRFIHDLICFTEPVKYVELIEMLKILFGESDYSIAKKHLALLRAMRSIEQVTDGDHFYRTCTHTLYFEYDRMDATAVAAAFKTLYLKNAPKRIYELNRSNQ